MERSIVRGLLVCFLLSATVVFAKEEGLIGGVSSGLYMLQELVRKVSLLGGIVVLFSGFLQLRAYRRNPVQTPLGRCVWFFIIALLLIGVNYLPSPVKG